MQRSKKTKGRPAAAALLLFSLAFSLHAASKHKPKPYDMELEAYPSAPFPSLHKFGTVTVHLYPGGVRADSFWLNAFSRRNTNSVTVMNPMMRMYTEVPITEVTSIVDRAAHADEVETTSAPPIVGPTMGKVGGLRAARYRLVYGPTAWIDVWTTADIPENVQFRALIDSLITGLSAPTARAARAIRGTPIYIELNFRRFNKVPLLKLKSLTWNNSGESDAMNVGSYYLKAPLLDAIWR